MLKALSLERQAQEKALMLQDFKAKLGVEVISTGDIFRELMKENSDLRQKS